VCNFSDELHEGNYCV